MKLVDKKLKIDLFHCKYSGGERAGGRIKDFYEVCGQAQKCVRWREDPRKLLRHMLHREGLRTRTGKSSRFEKGSRRDIQQLLNPARELSFEYKVHIVQSGLSKAELTVAHTDVLGATETFLMETYSMRLNVIASA
jgi:hypothetical protein